MKHIILIAAALFSTACLACTSPAVGTLEDVMAQATWTAKTGSDWNSNRAASVRIALPALDVAGRDCLTWSATLVLPAGATLTTEGDTGIRAGLAAGATATFALRVAPTSHSNEVRDERGWLRVTVRNPLDSPDVVLHGASGSPLWLYPVDFVFGD